MNHQANGARGDLALIDIQPLKPVVAGFERIETAHLFVRINADAFITYGAAKCILALRDCIIAGLLGIGRGAPRKERDENQFARHDCSDTWLQPSVKTALSR
jgi:hypothetical protein